MNQWVSVAKSKWIKESTMRKVYESNSQRCEKYMNQRVNDAESIWINKSTMRKLYELLSKSIFESMATTGTPLEVYFSGKLHRSQTHRSQYYVVIGKSIFESKVVRGPFRAIMIRVSAAKSIWIKESALRKVYESKSQRCEKYMNQRVSVAKSIWIKE